MPPLKSASHQAIKDIYIDTYIHKLFTDGYSPSVHANPRYNRPTPLHKQFPFKPLWRSEKGQRCNGLVNTTNKRYTHTEHRQHFPHILYTVSDIYISTRCASLFRFRNIKTIGFSIVSYCIKNKHKSFINKMIPVQQPLFFFNF